MSTRIERIEGSYEIISFYKNGIKLRERRRRILN